MRLSRKESQELTRTRIREAAMATIAAEGVAAVGVRSVAEHAGFSQGAFYSNYDCKNALLLDLMENHIREDQFITGELAEQVKDMDLDTALNTIAKFLASKAQDPRWSNLSVELQLYANRNPDFKLRFDDLRMLAHEAIAEVFTELCTRNDIKPALSPLQMAAGFFALWLGLSVQGPTRDALPPDEMAMAFLRAFMRPDQG